VDRVKKSNQSVCVILFVALLLAALISIGTLASGTVSSSVVINELMADNEFTIQSDHGNYTDWIELYNTADYAIDVSGMFLTDNLTTYSWQFPSNTTIQVHGYLLVWTDGNFRLGGLHTNFKLDSDGETIALFAADGSLVDSVTFGRQVQDISYGRTTDGGSNWNYLIDPTPGETNFVDTSLFSDYPLPIWVVLAVLLAVICLAVFRGKIFGGIVDVGG
jgi:hypothetical protein